MVTAITPSHAFEAHTGEVRLRLRAPSLASLLEEAARALAELMGSRADAGADGEPIEVEVRAPDREALLAGWIDELIFLSETHMRVWTQARVDSASDTELRGVVRGFEPVGLRTQVKAATMHELHVAETKPGSLEATLVLDV
jgi:SHS2 domain-containing protein